MVSAARRALPALLCAVMLLLTGCGGDEAESARLNTGASFRVAMTEVPESLNPITASDQTAEEFFLLAYDPLWRIDPSGTPTGCLAEDWSLSSDQLTWTIRLRQGVTFSDGTPLTSKDVRFSYENMGSSALYGDCLEGITGITCPDDYTVVITTSRMKGDMLYCSVPILPRSKWSEYEGDLGVFDNAEMIGSGPFVLSQEPSGPQEEAWTFQAREDYFGGSPKIGQVRFTYYNTEAGAARAIATGEADAAIGMTDVQLTTLEGVPGVELVQAYLPGSQVWALAFNTRDAFFQEASARQLVEYCTDRSRMLSMSSGESSRPGTVWASPGAAYFHQIANPRDYNPSAATATLGSLGYSDVDADGMMEFIGNREDLVLRLYTSALDDWSSTAASVLVEDLQAVGVQVSWQSTEGSVAAVCGPKDDWDMCMLSWRGSANAVTSAMRFCPGSKSLTGWESESYTQTYQQLCQTDDRDQINALAGQLQQLIYDDCVYVILGYNSDIQAIRTDLWTGYEDVLAATGGLFGTGSAQLYMTIEPVQAEES